MPDVIRTDLLTGQRIAPDGLGYVRCGVCDVVYEVEPGDPVTCPFAGMDGHDRA